MEGAVLRTLVNTDMRGSLTATAVAPRGGHLQLMNRRQWLPLPSQNLFSKLSSMQLSQERRLIARVHTFGNPNNSFYSEWFAWFVSMRDITCMTGGNLESYLAMHINSDAESEFECSEPNSMSGRHPMHLFPCIPCMPCIFCHAMPCHAFVDACELPCLLFMSCI